MKHLISAVAVTALVTSVAAAQAATAAPATPASPAAPAAQSRASLLAQAQSSLTSAAGRLGLSSGEKLVVKDVVADADGVTHTRYERTFDGLRVIGGDLVVHRSAAGADRGVTWNGSGAVAVASRTPGLSVAKAGAKARAAVADESLSGEQASPGELVVFAGAGKPRLAYDVVTRGIKPDQTPTVLHTVVDANSGATLSSWDEVKNGTGAGIFVGQVSLPTTLSNGSYLLKDSVGNVTTDLKGRTSGTGTTFADADDVWGNGTNSDRASAGVDAHYGAVTTFNYYSSVLGRAGIYNTGVGARSRVHYGNNYSNAFWDGTQMTYGDGSGNARPLVELDIAGHEMSHGVTENTANLNYSGDAGGLNEATSDIFGTAVEFFANNASDVPDYLIGEKVDLRGNGTPLRYMDQPSKDGSSQDCWTTGTKNLDPHYSSGPLNHWYFLASVGSGSRTVNGVSYNSPTCNSSAVTGVGHTTVEKIWYRALSTYLTSGSTYGNARDAAIQSAKDLYGAGSTQCTVVAASFSAISVPVQTKTC